VLRKYLPADPVIIDCGAHEGADSIELAKILGGKVHAFEPVPEIFRRLDQAVAGTPAIQTYPVALGNTTGHAHFHVSEGASDGSSSLLAPKDHLLDHTDTFFKRQIDVTTMTLDDWAGQLGIDTVDMLWLDMQGFELPMLKASTIVVPKVKVIHTEVSMKETYQGVSLYRDYRAYLESIGFSVVAEAIPAGWDMGNVVFARL
jgi:FkbM family methyltransferase